MNIQDFEIQTAIGRGAYGEVLMGVSKKTRRIYAIKVMNKHFIQSKGKSLSIYKEKALLKFLDHPYIVKLEASFVNSENLFLLMELVEGDDLGTIIEEQGRIDASLTRNIVRMLVEALKYINSVGVYHGDIKPQNIILTKEYKIKLVDFGCSSFFELNEKNHQVADQIQRFKEKLNQQDIDEFNGTSFYASPELCETGVNTWKDDLWSLGVLVYYMLTGRLPFDEDTEHLTFNKIVAFDYDKRPAVADNLLRVFLQQKLTSLIFC